MNTVYLSGPMTGLPYCNYKEFNKAARELRLHNNVVLNPAENFGGERLVVESVSPTTTKYTPITRKQFMRLDIHNLLMAEKVVLLPGWKKSSGAKLEVAMAIELGLPVARYIDGNLEEVKFKVTITVEEETENE